MLTIQPSPGHRGSLYYMRGDKPKYLARDLDLSDAGAVQQLVANARANYPTQALKLAVYSISGSVRKLEETLELSQPALAGTESPQMTHVASRPAVAAPGLPPGLDAMTTFILAQAQQQLVDKEATIADLRDDKKRQDEQLRTYEKQVMQLQFDLQHKDKEKEYAINDAVAAQPQGLAGFGQAMAPFLSPELVTMLATKFLGGAAPGPAAPQLGSHLTDGQRQVIQALTDWASQSEETAVKIYTLVAQAVSNAGGLDQLLEYCKTTFPQPQLRAA